MQVDLTLGDGRFGMGWISRLVSLVEENDSWMMFFQAGDRAGVFDAGFNGL